jgi:hypothetical protein
MLYQEVGLALIFKVLLLQGSGFRGRHTAVLVLVVYLGKKGVILR